MRKAALAALLCAAMVQASPGIRPLSEAMKQKMRGASWREGCPVSLDDLRELTVPYLDFSGRTRSGLLIVHKDVASELETILRRLYEERFQIARISPVEEFGASDDASMAANNTSAFNCRDTTGRPGVFSNHSWGRAIDINPLTNPYVQGELILPPGGRAYLDRTKPHPGSILAGSHIVRLFETMGWTWGGNWSDHKDYQHFEKPAR